MFRDSSRILFEKKKIGKDINVFINSLYNVNILPLSLLTLYYHIDIVQLNIW